MDETPRPNYTVAKSLTLHDLGRHLRPPGAGSTQRTPKDSTGFGKETQAVLRSGPSHRHTGFNLRPGEDQDATNPVFTVLWQRAKRAPEVAARQVLVYEDPCQGEAGE